MHQTYFPVHEELSVLSLGAFCVCVAPFPLFSGLGLKTPFSMFLIVSLVSLIYTIN